MPLDELTFFLEKHEAEVVEEFRKQVVVSNHDQFRGMIHLNGQAMYRLVVGYLDERISREDIKHLAYKVAHERNQAEINIGDFVYNVCLGRQLLCDLLQKGPFSPSTLVPAMIKINECFDHFLVHAVSRYTSLRESDLEEKKLFIERSHKDRLTILGQMAASFVHEFRNPLTSIIGFSRLLKEDYPSLPYVDIIENELYQLNYRVSQFLLVSKKGEVYKTKERFQMQGLFEEILAFLYPNIVDVNANMTCNIDPAFILDGYKDEIKQVFINIISNALDALQKKVGDKEVVIEAFQKADVAVIRIANNGAPIPVDLLPVIFEPFFTTKELGTGIGLYVCKEIIEKHGGTITCESTEERTVFSMEFLL
ncbi:sensor histidine kinase [Brevibacillus reuszeri]|uniref:histidine kinase n=1 Tax=Brevibacillus reuszeri TaxID=54915 RepID=A0A0K9YMF3_9BACL|nr:histidine kinase N-terminal domain-containing protein [Brevibacillus reuszeri]KNB69933.1 histidine kinase [Brevibacillus reuszeri]MED1858295.1 histidine kinase N-terminal domain-containing protein [Brevibacillus reuszeri]GED68709.1 sensor histidine kinase [Brevibacillus reuszeri]